MSLTGQGSNPSGLKNNSHLQSEHHMSHLSPIREPRHDSNAVQPASNSQESNVSTSSDRVFTSTASTTDGTSQDTTGMGPPTSTSQISQLDQLSALAAAQDRMTTNNGGGFKRSADGEVKPLEGSVSPTKGHSRNTSAMSNISTTSTITDLTSDLKTRLSYAKLKVQNGWESNSLDQVESLASQAASPTSSSSTVHRLSASPRIPLMNARPQPPPYDRAPFPRKKSTSPVQPPSAHRQSGLAPPAPIRPSVGAPPPNKRRNSTARPPTLLGGAAVSPANHMSPMAGNQSRPRDPAADVREQDAIETLLFMSSPGNSANMKHAALSPAASPGPNQVTNPPSAMSKPPTANRHPLPGGPARRTLPGGRTGLPEKRVAFSPLTTTAPQSPMDLDSPYQVNGHQSPHQSGAQQRRRVNGASSHLRGALSLPSGLGVSQSKEKRKVKIDDAYIERMLERAAAESSDEGEIELPPRRGGAGVHA